MVAVGRRGRKRRGRGGAPVAAAAPEERQVEPAAVDVVAVDGAIAAVPLVVLFEDGVVELGKVSGGGGFAEKLAENGGGDGFLAFLAEAEAVDGQRFSFGG